MAAPHSHRLPSLKQLEAFLVIESTRNLTEAANRLHVSQPALSRTLQLMEEAVQARLFERNTRSMELTPAGVAMLPIAKRLVGEFHESFGRFGEFLGGQRGQVVVAGLPSVVVALMPLAIQRLAQVSPGVEVKVLSFVEQQVLAAVRAGSVDFALATQPASSGGLSFEQLLNDEYVLVCRKDDPLARRRTAPWSAVERRSFVAMAPSSSVRPVTDRVFVELGIAVEVRYESDNISLMGPMVAAGLGVSVLPRLALALTDCSQLAVVRLTSPEVSRSVGLLQRVDAPLSPVAGRLLEILRETPRHAGYKRASRQT
ncbi:LysR family transcriptional regulator [Ottowia sp. VDI28]|uniref:LysR family transcriptional regulator n=1 Tax=Ottowia sp. VDI28 TaxID=3133968 RepID=UPI003C2BB203